MAEQLMIETFFCPRCKVRVNVVGKWVQEEKMLNCAQCGQRNFEAESINKKAIEDEIQERKKVRRAEIREREKAIREEEKKEKRRQAWLSQAK